MEIGPGADRPPSLLTPRAFVSIRSELPCAGNHGQTQDLFIDWRGLDSIQLRRFHSRPAQSLMEKIKILLFAANPLGTDRLDLGREFREIDEEIRQGEYRDNLELILVPGARLVDFLRKLNKDRPQIVHFSGHGGSDASLMLECDEEEREPGSWRSGTVRDMKQVYGGTSAESEPAKRIHPLGKPAACRGVAIV